MEKNGAARITIRADRSTGPNLLDRYDRDHEGTINDVSVDFRDLIDWK
jgi:hypothetical protein